MNRDVFGQAIKDYYEQNSPAKLWIFNRYGPKEEMPVATYFRTENEMPELEHLALECCEGKILDIGAGAGSHSLILQQRGFDVTALDISPLAVQTIKARGVQKALPEDIFNYHDATFDTLLLLMNGIGLSGTLEGLERLLLHVKTLLKPGGQVLLDSSDISYLYTNKPKPAHYYGEIAYQYSYKSKKTVWFNWLYVDYATLSRIAKKTGWQAEQLFDDGYDQYLAKLILV